ncbi:hypothetical protein Leryth_001586 [Lithospermum erythrorhizon]|uniref:Uncharacterized protein n=1 Tax=Lithospermum erythrorhizon TaxID=34254 RepID=A0AAV3S1Q4_LITER|nr:hypothetical protein Leryth_001586 [Lithospermum erythrorhizon]
MKGETIVEACYVFKEETILTVLKTSIFFSGDGFSAYDSKGELVFRVDWYGADTDNTEVVLMDATGRCLLTVCRKRPSLHHRWEGFLGERSEGQKPIFSVSRSAIIERCNVTVEMYNTLGEEYHIEGSLAQRCCKIFDANNETMAEIRRKVDALSNVMLGKDVLSLNVKPGFDGAFAMALVIILDQIDGYDYLDNSPYNNIISYKSI